MLLKDKLYNEAIEKLQKDNLVPKKDVSLINYGLDAIQKAIDFGIERETPKLKADETLSIKVSKVPIGFKVDVLRVKKD